MTDKAISPSGSPAYDGLPSPNDPSPEGLWAAGRSFSFAQAGARPSFARLAMLGRNPCWKVTMFLDPRFLSC